MADTVTISTLSVLISILSLVFSLRNQMKSNNITLFLKFTDRYDDIIEKLIPILEKKRLGSEIDPADRVTLKSYLNLCSEEYFYKDNKYLDPALWAIWEKEIVDNLKILH